MNTQKLGDISDISEGDFSDVDFAEDDKIPTKAPSTPTTEPLLRDDSSENRQQPQETPQQEQFENIPQEGNFENPQEEEIDLVCSIYI